VVEGAYNLAATTEFYKVQSIIHVEHVVFTLLSLAFSYLFLNSGCICLKHVISKLWPWAKFLDTRNHH